MKKKLTGENIKELELTQYFDLAKDLLNKLFPINRSLTGEGNRETCSRRSYCSPTRTLVRNREHCTPRSK